MRFERPFLPVTILLAACVLSGLSIVNSAAVDVGEKPAVGNEILAADEDKMVGCIYPLADLPVYRQTGDEYRFDPSLVFALVKNAVAPQSWGAGRIEICTNPAEPCSAIVFQTPANHQRVEEFLATLRKSEQVLPAASGAR